MISPILIAMIILICVFLDRVSDRFGIPVLLGFILLGIFFGSDGVVKIPFDNYSFAEQVCSIALIFIMFYGGFGTNWEHARPAAGKAVLLSTFGVLMTAGVTGVLCHYILSISWIESFLIGALLSSTDAASVFSILRSKQLNLKYNTASLLELESGSNDPVAYMMTAILITVAKGSLNSYQLIQMLVLQIGGGIVCGILFAAVSVYLMKHYRFMEWANKNFAPNAEAQPARLIIEVSNPADSSIAGYFQKKGYETEDGKLDAGKTTYFLRLIVGIVLGNSDIKNKTNLVHFFDGMTGLTQILIFFLLGLLAFPSRLPQVVLPALVIALIVTFIARPLSVFLVLTPFRAKAAQQILVCWSGLRGAASIVFAMMVTQSLKLENDIYHIVFTVVLFSILFQGTLLPAVARKLDMIDESDTVLKTFNDYSNEVPVQFIQFMVTREHAWCGRALCEINLPPETLVVLLERESKNIVPNGQTILLEGDRLILSALAPEEVTGIRLLEKHLEEGHKYVGKKLSEIKTGKNELIIMIQREGSIIIPNGNDVLQAGDMVVINRSK